MKKAREIEPIAACSAAPSPKQEHRFAAAVLYMEDKGTLAAICDTFRIEKQAAFYYVGLFRNVRLQHVSAKEEGDPHQCGRRVEKARWRGDMCRLHGGARRGRWKKGCGRGRG
jgi:hypothetical protein